jgi:IS30 family transposase
MSKYQKLRIDEREMFGQYLSKGKNLRFIALRLNLQVSTTRREIKHFTNSGT